MVGIIAPFYGAAAEPAGTPALTDRDIVGASETSAWKLEADGDELADTGDGSGFVDIGDWIAPKEGMDQYEVRATLVAGALATGVSSPLSAWLSLGTEQKWRCKIAGPTNPDTSAVLTVEIRPVGGVTVTSATISLSGTFGG